MTREEAKNFVRVISLAYPSYKPDDLTETVNFYAYSLKDVPTQIAQAALRIHISKNKFPPTIADIMEIIGEYFNKSNDAINPIDASVMVRKAIANSGYHAEEEFSKLPELVQRTVGAPAKLRQWASTTNEVALDIAMKGFMEDYSTNLKREKEIRKMPKSVQELIGVTIGKDCALEDKKCVESQNTSLEQYKSYEGSTIPEHLQEKYNELLKKLGK